MNTPPVKQIPSPNKLALPSLAVGFITASLSPLAFFPSTIVFYMIAVLPLSLIAIILARVAINHSKAGKGTVVDRNMAVIAYFLSFLPALSLCGLLTFQLYDL